MITHVKNHQNGKEYDFDTGFLSVKDSIFISSCGLFKAVKTPKKREYKVYDMDGSLYETVTY